MMKHRAHDARLWADDSDKLRRCHGRRYRVVDHKSPPSEGLSV